MDKHGWDLQRFVLGLRYRVIALDNRGAGRSDKPAGGYDLARMADDAIAVLDRRRGRAGPHRRRVDGWRDQPDPRGRAPRPDPLAHPGVLGVPQPAVADPAPAPVGRGRRDQGPRPDDQGGGPLGDRTPLVPAPRPAARLAGPLGMGRPSHAFQGQVAAILAVEDAMPADLADIAVPAMVIVGNQDILTPRGDSEELAERIPTAELVVISGAAHGVMIEHASTFNKVLGRVPRPGRAGLPEDAGRRGRRHPGRQLTLPRRGSPHVLVQEARRSAVTDAALVDDGAVADARREAASPSAIRQTRMVRRSPGITGAENRPSIDAKRRIRPAHGVQQRTAREAVGAQPVQDRGREPTSGGERRVGVQRIAVAGQSVEQRLVGVVAYSTTSSGSRSGGCVPRPDGPRSPPQPPDSRMNSEARVVNSGDPSSCTPSVRNTTTEADPAPLSYIASIDGVRIVVPSAGKAVSSVTDCNPCTSLARS